MALDGRRTLRAPKEVVLDGHRTLRAPPLDVALVGGRTLRAPPKDVALDARRTLCAPLNELDGRCTRGGAHRVVCRAGLLLRLSQRLVALRATLRSFAPHGWFNVPLLAPARRRRGVQSQPAQCACVDGRVSTTRIL